MKLRGCTRSVMVAVPLLAVFLVGCGNFWQAPSGTSSTSFSLSNSGDITIAPGATSGNTATITVTPGSSFTGTVSLSCSITSQPSSATSPATCGLSPTSVSISASTAETSTLTATTTSSTTTGAYDIQVTGTSGSVTESTTVCVEVSASSSGSCSSGSGTSGVFYVLNQTTNQVVSATINSGQLNTLDAVTLPATNPFAIAVAPNGNFLYVSTVQGVYLYTVGSNGALTLGNGGAPITADPATTMQVDATNSWLVEGVSGVNALYAVAINSSTGELAAAGESDQTASLPASTTVQLAISPTDSGTCNKCYVFVAMGSGGIEMVPFNPANANPFGTSLLHINLVKSGGGANAIAVDPSNRLLYVGESAALSSTQSGGLAVYTISAGGANAISGSPYATGGTGPSSILPTADGNYVYVANRSVSGSSTDNITGFSVSTTALSQLGTVAAGPTGQIGLAEDSTGSYVLAVDLVGNPDLQAYSMSSGMLTSVFTGATGIDPVGAVAVAAAP